MDQVTIRPFKSEDIDATVQIMRASFPDEMAAMGVSVDDTERQYRNALRLRMVPFRVLTAVSRITWEFWVATLSGEVVGVGRMAGKSC